MKDVGKITVIKPEHVRKQPFQPMTEHVKSIRIKVVITGI